MNDVIAAFIGGPACGRTDVLLSRMMPFPPVYELNGATYQHIGGDFSGQGPVYRYRRPEPRETIGA